MDNLEGINLDISIIKGRLSLYKRSKERSKNDKGENEKRKRFHRQIVSNVIKDESLLIDEIERLKALLYEVK